MAHRFTIKELNEMSDTQLLTMLVNERRNGCTNPYAPLHQRLTKLLANMEQKPAPQRTPEKPRILIEVKGGMVQNIAATTDEVRLFVADYDNQSDVDGTFTYYDGTPDQVLTTHEMDDAITNADNH